MDKPHGFAGVLGTGKSAMMKKTSASDGDHRNWEAPNDAAAGEDGARVEAQTPEACQESLAGKERAFGAGAGPGNWRQSAVEGIRQAQQPEA